jgi:D-tyrosyl-tRNA(Tyr) deacylase
MKAVIQRVTHASVTVDNKIIGEIGLGFLVLLGVVDGDTEEEMKLLAKKTAGIRIFTDENDKMNLSTRDINGGFLVISQFTLCADTASGNRPSFSPAAHPSVANPLYEAFVGECRALGIPTGTGVFGADMKIALCNDGPVTFILEEPNDGK